jgi:hypothetical protein
VSEDRFTNRPVRHSPQLPGPIGTTEREGEEGADRQEEEDGAQTKARENTTHGPKAMKFFFLILGMINGYTKTMPDGQIISKVDPDLFFWTMSRTHCSLWYLVN